MALSAQAFPSSSPSRETLRRVALGEEPADLVITNGRLVSVLTREVLSDWQIAIKGDRIAAIGDCRHTIGAATICLDAEGAYLTPGLIDGHMHVESTMLTVRELARAILPHGTTAIVMDPHEMANVFGLAGVRLMHEEGLALPLRVFTTVPSCVPAAPGLEDAGASIGPEDVREALGWPQVLGLSEVMDFLGVLRGDPRMMGEIAETFRQGKVVTGHVPLADPKQVGAYLVSGPDSDHESTSRQEALLKARLGLTVMIREGSAWQDVRECIRILTEDGVDPRQVVLVTDDVDARTLREVGHLNHVVRRAIEEGVDPLLAVQLATVQPARYFGLHDLGQLTPGARADILLVPDLRRMEPSRVLVGGRVVAEGGEVVAELPAYPYPDWARRSVRLPAELGREELLPRSARSGQTEVRVIRAIDRSALTQAVIASLPVREGIILADPEQDIVHMASIARHGRSAVGLGFVQGLGLRSGAVASTVAHDSHNILVAGVEATDMLFAIRFLAERQGGLVVVEGQQVLAFVPLPIAGLMSEAGLPEVVAQVAELDAAWRRLGSRLHAPFMTFSLLALPVIPELRLTDRGLVDVLSGRLVPLEVEADG